MILSELLAALTAAMNEGVVSAASQVYVEGCDCESRADGILVEAGGLLILAEDGRSTPKERKQRATWLRQS